MTDRRIELATRRVILQLLPVNLNKNMKESWDEALFGTLEGASPVKEAAPIAKKVAPEKITKEFLPEGSGGRALEENQKAKELIEQELKKMRDDIAAGVNVNLDDVKRKTELLQKIQEDESRIRAGGI